MAAAAAALLIVFSLILAGPVKPKETTPSKTEPNSMVYVRVHLAPWGGDVRIQRAFDDCWQQLENLENRR
jgi:hypothetical protein